MKVGYSSLSYKVQNIWETSLHGLHFSVAIVGEEVYGRCLYKEKGTFVFLGNVPPYISLSLFFALEYWCEVYWLGELGRFSST